ncbi:MAG: hypothetical protein KAI17_10170 [Thiotrichaceae bacterium]|nr:hypothetical protein [Thiotrichaceae bacterium]
MNLSICIVIDPLETLKPTMDTSLLIAGECHDRGHKVYVTTGNSLFFFRDTTWATVQEFCFKRNLTYTSIMEFAKENTTLPLSNFDIVLMRTDPPVNPKYFGFTYLLDYANTLVLNSPSILRNVTEKSLVLRWPDYTPTCAMSVNPENLIDIVKKDSDVIWVAKPANNFNGNAVFKISAKELKNAISAIQICTNNGTELAILQEFLPEVVEGDKKIFMIGKEIVGAMNRLPIDDDFRANIHLGAKSEKTVLTKRERHICETVGAYCDSIGAPITCIDMIGEQLTEINITSPSGIPEINKVEKSHFEEVIVDYLEKYVSQN